VVVFIYDKPKYTKQWSKKEITGAKTPKYYNFDKTIIGKSMSFSSG
jgi:hypothetical protein